MRTFAFLLLLCSGALGLRASSYDYLVLRQSDGTATSLVASGLRITFSDGNLVATNGSLIQRFALASLASMNFSDDATAIQAAPSETLRLTARGGQISLQAPEGTVVEVFATDGRLLSRYAKQLSGNEALPATFPKGVYIIKVANQTHKLLLK